MTMSESMCSRCNYFNKWSRCNKYERDQDDTELDICKHYLGLGFKGVCELIIEENTNAITKRG